MHDGVYSNETVPDANGGKFESLPDLLYIFFFVNISMYILFFHLLLCRNTVILIYLLFLINQRVILGNCTLRFSRSLSV